MLIGYLSLLWIFFRPHFIPFDKFGILLTDYIQVYIYMRTKFLESKAPNTSVSVTFHNDIINSEETF